MKKKHIFSVVLSLFLALFIAVPAFAGTGSLSFNLSSGDSTTLSQYIKVNSGGSVTVSVNGIPSGARVKAVVYNPINGNELTTTFTANNQSRTFTNLKPAEYNILIENEGSSRISGSIGFSWDGTWGRWIE
ncbi:hypothetical protein [Paenibacillus massiliensis]|uniref:hypothetical protein n=1 Tax=Paenibacillus massiliensis TaxID=225917 RepID=UPI000471B952|nr:hypothetical protein [Paenibacillus massiliensis]